MSGEMVFKKNSGNPPGFPAHTPGKDLLHYVGTFGNGNCVPSGDPCAGNSDCPGGETCNTGTCTIGGDPMRVRRRLLGRRQHLHPHPHADRHRDEVLRRRRRRSHRGGAKHRGVHDPRRRRRGRGTRRHRQLPDHRKSAERVQRPGSRDLPERAQQRVPERRELPAGRLRRRRRRRSLRSVQRPRRRGVRVRRQHSRPALRTVRSRRPKRTEWQPLLRHLHDLGLVQGQQHSVHDRSRVSDRRGLLRQQRARSQRGLRRRQRDRRRPLHDRVRRQSDRHADPRLRGSDRSLHHPGLREKRRLHKDSKDAPDLDRWKTKGDFNFTEGIEIDADTQDVSITYNNNLSGVLFSSGLSPGNCTPSPCFVQSGTATKPKWKFLDKEADVPLSPSWRKGKLSRVTNKIKYGLDGRKVSLVHRRRSRRTAGHASDDPHRRRVRDDDAGLRDQGQRQGAQVRVDAVRMRHG